MTAQGAVTAPTNAALSRWWERILPHLPEALSCADCGKTNAPAYVQPQHPYWAAKRGEGVEVDEHGLARITGRIVALCANCIAESNARARADRKAALAAMPRCEVSTCRARGVYRAGGCRVLLCRRHMTAAQAAHARAMAGAGAMALFLPAPAYTREEILEMAAGAARRTR